MSWSNSTILSAVELVVYLLFIPLTLFTALKHRRSGMFGHIYLLIFISTRIIADGITISDRNKPNGTSTAGVVANAIGLSPLLLANMAIVNEARSFSNSNTESPKKPNLIAELIMHIVVVSGVVLLALGSVDAASAKNQSELDKDRHHAEAGAAILLVSWIVVCVWACFTFLQCRRTRNVSLSSRLMTATMISLPFLGVRVFYTVVYTFDHSPKLSPATASFAVKLILVVLMQLVVFLSLQIGLLVSRRIAGQAPGAAPSNDIQLNAPGWRYKEPGTEAVTV